MLEKLFVSKIRTFVQEIRTGGGKWIRVKFIKLEKLKLIVYSPVILRGRWMLLFFGGISNGRNSGFYWWGIFI